MSTAVPLVIPGPPNHSTSGGNSSSTESGQSLEAAQASIQATASLCLDCQYPLLVHASHNTMRVICVQTLQVLQTLSTITPHTIPAANVSQNNNQNVHYRKNPIILRACRFLDQNHIFSIDSKGDIRVWDWKRGAVILKTKSKHKSLSLQQIILWKQNNIQSTMAQSRKNLQQNEEAGSVESSVYNILLVGRHGMIEYWRFLMETCIDYKSNDPTFKYQCVPLWTLETNIDILSMSVSPFDRSQASITARDGWMYFVTDLSPFHMPRTLIKSFRVSQTQVYDLIWSPHCHDQLYLVTKREVVIYDLQLRKTLVGRSIRGHSGSAVVRSDFISVRFSETDPNLFFTTHLDGSVGGWVLNQDLGSENNNFKYEYAFCDVIRGSKHGLDRPGSLVGITFAPEQRQVIAYDVEGNMFFWRFDPSRPKYKWSMTGFIESISGLLSSMHVCPVADRGNIVAVGTQTGNVYLYDLITGLMTHKYDVFDSEVRGIRWSSDSSIVCFTSKKLSSGQYQNRLVSLSLHTGEYLFLKDEQDSVDSLVQGVRVSPSFRYMLVTLKDRPVEVWSLESYSIIRILPIYDITAIEWCPAGQGLEESETSVSFERFFFTSTDGALHFYRVQRRQVAEEKSTPRMFANNQITALAWQHQFLVSGDIFGNLIVFDTKTRDAKTYPPSQRGVCVRNISFSPRGSYVCVLFADSSFQVWELNNGNLVAQSPYDHKFTSIGWTTNNLPIAVTSTSSIMIFDFRVRRCQIPLGKRSLSEPLPSPTTLSFRECEKLQALLEHEQFSETLSQTVSQLAERVSLPNEFKSDIKDASTLGQKLLIIAHLFRNEEAIRFWTLALKFIGEWKDNTDLLKNREDISGIPTASVDPGSQPESEFDTKRYTKSLPSIFNLLRDNESVQHDEQQLLRAFDHTVRTLSQHSSSTDNTEGSDLYETVGQKEAIFGQKDEAVRLLLETPTNHKDRHLNIFHACVIAASNSQEHFRQTIMYAASGLISGPSRTRRDINYAVELYCLINEGYRACKILQNFELWYDAARLAKCLLPEKECRDILSRWASHSSSRGNHMEAIGVWLSLGYFHNVLELLYQSGMDSVAIGFLRTLEEAQVPIIKCRHDDPDRVLSESGGEKEKSNDSEASLDQLKRDVKTSYSKRLRWLGLEELSSIYAHKEME